MSGGIGGVPGGRGHGEEAIRIAEAVDHPFSLATAYCGVGGLYLHKGDLAKAIQALEHSLDLCETWDIQVLFPDAAAQLGYAYALAGRTAHAITLLEQAVGHPAATAPMAYHARKLTWLSEAYLLVGEIERAQARVQESFTLFRQCQERGGHQAWALRLLGEIASQQQPPATAQADIHYQQALVLAERHAMRPCRPIFISVLGVCTAASAASPRHAMNCLWRRTTIARWKCHFGAFAPRARRRRRD